MEQVIINLWLGDTNIATRKLVRCVYCGKVVCETNGDVKTIVIGDIQREIGVRCIQVQCKNCGVMYQFMD